MADVKQIQIGENIYSICDVDSRDSLLRKQNTISDLSTIRSNASTGATNAATAITRLNNFNVTFINATNSEPVTLSAGPGAGRLGTASNSRLDNKVSAPSGYSFIGATSFNSGVAAVIVTRVYYSSGDTILTLRKIGTGTATVAVDTAASRDTYIKLG